MIIVPRLACNMLKKRIGLPNKNNINILLLKIYIYYSDNLKIWPVRKKLILLLTMIKKK